MDRDIINYYINFVKKNILTFYHILLNNKYETNLINPLVDKYIDIRYFNNTLSKEKDTIKLIDDELKPIVKNAIINNPKKEELIKNIYVIFSYVLYFDDVAIYDNLTVLVNALLADDLISLTYNDDVKEQLTNFIIDVENKKEEFNRLFNTSLFTLNESRLRKNLYEVSIDNHSKIPKIYSDYAINKAFNSGTVNEDKYYVLYSMLAYNILKSAIDLDFINNYIVELPITLYNKNKKIERILNIINNDLTKNRIYFKITFNNYINNKDLVNGFIKEGYKFALELDDNFNNDLDSLVLFSYVLVYDYLDCYDMIMDSRKDIKPKVISL